MRCSEDVQDVFWMSYVRPVYVLYLRGNKNLIMDSYKITNNNCRSRLYSSLIQTQKNYLPPKQKKYSNLKTICHIKPKFFWWTKLLENTLFEKYLISVSATLTTKLLIFWILWYKKIWEEDIAKQSRYETECYLFQSDHVVIVHFKMICKVF